MYKANIMSLAQYKEYARDLFKIKIAQLGKKPDNGFEELLKFFEQLNELRPKLRSDLQSLSDEFLGLGYYSDDEMLGGINKVNDFWIRKLQRLAVDAKKDIRKFRTFAAINKSKLQSLINEL